MKDYDKMMDAVWNLNALAAGFQTSRILCRDIIEKKAQYQTCLASGDLGPDAAAFWQDSVKSLLGEIDSYSGELREISVFLNELMGGTQK